MKLQPVFSCSQCSASLSFLQLVSFFSWSLQESEEMCHYSSGTTFRVYNRHACRLLQAHEAVGEWSRMAPFRIMSIDIECLGRKGCFPEAEKDPVIQIASVVSTPGAKEPLLRHIVTLDSCSGIPGAQVEPFDNESDLLLRCAFPLSLRDEKHVFAISYRFILSLSLSVSFRLYVQRTQENVLCVASINCTNRPLIAPHSHQSHACLFVNFRAIT
jgi:hypothetical protein